MIISSKNNEVIKEIKKLKEKKYRENKFIVEGIKIVEEAINEQVKISLIVISENLFNNNESIKYFEKLTQYKYIIVTEKVFLELSDVKTPQGILAVIEKDINAKIDEDADYIMALDDLQDPGNIGTIIRTLDSANIKQLIVSKGTVDAYSPKVVRSTMGAIFRVKVIEVDNLAETLKKLQKDGYEVVSTSLQTDKSIYDISYNKKVVVIGNEGNGVSKEIQELSDYKVKIPMLGKTESLNASVAASIMIYEYVREKFSMGDVPFSKKLY